MDRRRAQNFRPEYPCLHEDLKLANQAKWQKLSKIIGTRSENQCRSHAQKVCKKDEDILTNPDRFGERPEEERKRALEEMKELGRSMRKRNLPKGRQEHRMEETPLLAPSILEVGEKGSRADRRAGKSKEKDSEWMNQLKYSFSMNGKFSLEVIHEDEELSSEKAPEKAQSTQPIIHADSLHSSLPSQPSHPNQSNHPRKPNQSNHPRKPNQPNQPNQPIQPNQPHHQQPQVAESSTSNPLISLRQDYQDRLRFYPIEQKPPVQPKPKSEFKVDYKRVDLRNMQPVIQMPEVQPREGLRLNTYEEVLRREEIEKQLLGRNEGGLVVSRNSSFRPYILQHPPVLFGGPRSNFTRVTDLTPVPPRLMSDFPEPEDSQSEDESDPNSMSDA